MRVRVHGPNGSRPVAMSIDDDKATVADLLQALGASELPTLVFDGRPLAGDDRLVELGLLTGDELHVDAAPLDPFRPERGGVGVIAVVAGVDTGRRILAGADRRITIGRAAHNDLVIENRTVSTDHAEITISAGRATVRDLDSHNGTWLDGRAVPIAELEPGAQLGLGSSTIAVLAPDESDRVIGSSRAAADERGRILVNRPPRRPLPTLTGPVELPPPRPERSDLVFSLVAFAIPIVFAGVLVAVLGSWRYALFALLSPVMVLGNHLAGRRRLRKQRSGDVEARSSALRRFEGELESAVAALRRRHEAMAPSLAEVRRRIELPSSRLWERRLDAEDAMVVGLGRGSIPWTPPLSDARAGSAGGEDGEVDRILDGRSVIDDIEILADLNRGPLGVVGSGGDAVAMARSVTLQLAAAHGPADLSIVVLTDAGRVDTWSWAQWLPHTLDVGGGALVLAEGSATEFARRLLDRLDADPSRSSTPISSAHLLVVDDVALLHGRSSPVRRLLERTPQGVFGLVVAEEEEQLPASTATVVGLGDHGGFDARHPQEVDAVAGSGIADLVALDTAEEMAAALARFEDPELDDATSSVPVSVAASQLFGSLLDRPEAVRAQWEASRRADGLRAPIGLGIEGTAAIDLVGDGPHGLVAGTTGSGKSEFLRTLVAGLALHHPPDDLVFVLIDYKGGSAFDRCSDLPHVVGFVTDLDDHLAERALQSLEAELHYRERLLRQHGAGDIVDYRRLDPRPGPLPRLVVVIDEFATLRRELPDFVDALVGIAQRGRSLGVHLILATQRPSGAVDANIRANTNLRVALRVQDTADSADVIDSKNAADIARERPGRAFIRRGAADLAEIQTALVSGRLRDPDDPRVRVAAIPIGSGRPPEFVVDDGEGDGSELDRIVDVVARAHSGRAEPRRPWLDDLAPNVVEHDARGLESGDGMPRLLAIGDDPAHQRRVTLGWDPSEGNLAVYGSLGSGVSTLLRSCIAELGRRDGDRPAWVYVSDHGAGGLLDVERHAHVGCRLDEQEPARHRRLLTMLESEVTERRARGRAEVERWPLIVLVIDGVAGFLETAGALVGEPQSDCFDRIVRDGPAVGVVVVAAAAATRDMPRVMHPTIRRQYVLELSDRNDLQALGIRPRTLPSFRPGRALVGIDARVAQIICRNDHPDVVLDGDRPPPVEELPVLVPADAIGDAVEFDPALRIPIGLDDRTRRDALLTLRRGEHGVVSGPAGSGRTTALRLIAQRLRGSDPDLVLVGIAPADAVERFAGIGFDALGSVDDLAPVLATAGSDARRWVIVVDDAETIRDDGGLLDGLASGGRRGLTIVAGMRSAAVRGLFGHWTRHVRNAGVGVLLDPDNAVDGEVLGVRLPRAERLASTPGRGYLVSAGQINAIQLAHGP